MVPGTWWPGWGAVLRRLISGADDKEAAMGARRLDEARLLDGQAAMAGAIAQLTEAYRRHVNAQSYAVRHPGPAAQQEQQRSQLVLDEAVLALLSIYAEAYQ